jgi:hypothetical protein
LKVQQNLDLVDVGVDVSVNVVVNVRVDVDVDVRVPTVPPYHLREGLLRASVYNNNPPDAPCIWGVFRLDEWAVFILVR